MWGDFGLRMKDHDRRMPSASLRLAEETIKRRLRGMKYKLYKRVSANIGVYTKGNEQRMGKGKGKFDYWAVRLPVSRVVFELKGDLHEKIAREAFRLAGHKLPGMLFSFYHKICLESFLLIPLRSLGIRQERRSAGCRYHETRQRRHTRIPQTSPQRSAPRHKQHYQPAQECLVEFISISIGRHSLFLYLLKFSMLLSRLGPESRTTSISLVSSGLCGGCIAILGVGFHILCILSSAFISLLCGLNRRNF